MVDFTTAIIFQYIYFIPQKDKCFAITYFRVACYSINWIHNLRRHFVYKVSAVEIMSCWNIGYYISNRYHSNMSEKLDVFLSFLFFYHFTNFI
jgi:hypothetical protein